MMRRLLLGGVGVAPRSAAATSIAQRSAAAASMSSQPAARAAAAAAAPRPAPTTGRVGEYLRPHLDVLKVLRKLLPRVGTPPQPKQQLPPPQQDGILSPFECLNRNARRGKRANHGKRPVSSARRKYKTKTFGKK